MLFVGLSALGLLENMAADGTIGLILYRVIAHEWIWDSLRKKPEWNIGLSANGWKIEGSGQNPITTIQKMFNDFLNPEPEDLDYKIDKHLDKMIDKNIDIVLEKMIKKPRIQHEIQKKIYDKLQGKIYDKTKK